MKIFVTSLLSLVLLVVISYISAGIVPEDSSISNETLNNRTDWTLDELEGTDSDLVDVNGSRIEDNERSARLRRSCDCWTTLGRCMSAGSRQCYFVNGPSVVKCVGDSSWKRVRRCQSGCVWNNDNPYYVFVLGDTHLTELFIQVLSLNNFSMVLKSIVRYIINNYLKDYIEKLDDERLKLDLRHGDVSLENLHLKPEALIGFGIPVTVVVGFIEKLSIVIPWKNLHSNPTKVYLNGLYMLIVPKNEVRQDLREYHEEKMKKVQRKLDNLRKATSDENKFEEKEKSFFERMKIQMMQNLQLNLKNLHISYETMSTTKLGHPFSFGFTISSLQFHSSTNSEQIGKNKENSLIIFKLNEMNDFSLYWNTNCQSRINLPYQCVLDDLKSKIARDDQKPKRYMMNYVFHPTNLKFQLEMSMKFAEENFEKPIVKIDFRIEEMNFEIDPKQFSDLLDFVKFQNYSVFYDRCREYRQLYLKEYLSNSTLTLEESNRIYILESKLDVYTMAYIRHSIELEFHHQDENEKKYSWWNWWWKGKENSNQNQFQNNPGEFFSEESLNTDVNIEINKLGFNLLFPKRKRKSHENNVIISHISIENTQISYKRRTISSSILCVLNLGYFQIFGLKSSDNSRPLMLTSAMKSLNSLIHIEFELAPINKQSDYRFLLLMEPLTIIYHAATINEIVENFEPIREDYLPFIVPKMKERTFAEIEKDLLNKKIFDMTIKIKGLSLLSPENGIYTQDSKLVCVQFQNLLIKSVLNNNNQENTEERRFYVKYNLILNDLKIVYLRPNKDRIDVLKSIPQLETTFYKCIYSDQMNFMDWKIDFQINQMNSVNLSKRTLKKLMNHLQSIPLFYSSMTQTIQRVNLFFKIFSPYSTIQFDVTIQNSSFVITRSQKSIQTNFYGRLLRTRLNEDQLINSFEIAFRNLIMTLSNQSFYRKDSIQIMYFN
ncbi:unnamed protein product [Adineta ricciae]|uniref:Chorein N-terminal domain-containing protein n=1 Tax=Adineta ricciae TaxID=249248 RepID=A0A815AN56_ADIRI|nr:unnamed protein product [Adineta ricciae]CAF1259689.1 unnamed protein product [Adineta ricciae]